MALFKGFVLLCVVSLAHQESCTDNHVPAGSQLHRELLGYAAKHNNVSFLVSGYSLIDPLMILLRAAEGDTKKQLKAALSPFSKELTPNELVCKTPVSGGANYTKASKIYIATQYKINPRFMEDIGNEIGTELGNIDFSNKNAADEINSWVRQRTSGLIKTLVKQEEIVGAIAIIANTLYFQANWESKFNENKTKYDDFYVTPNETQRMPFMNQHHYYSLGYLPELDATVLLIPLRGKYRFTRSSMRFFIPNEPGGLQTVLSQISKGNYSIKYEEVYLSLSLPKFEVETSLDLKGFLRSIGVVDLFDGNSELPHILLKKIPLVVTKALQKTKISLDENGVEAAAANEFQLMATSSNYPGPKPIEFKLNRPFYFDIVVNEKVLFSGAFRGPKLYKGD